MKILVAGASGLIGSRVARALVDAGHQVACAGRTPPRDARMAFVPADFARVPDAAWWLPHLRGVDAVVNAAGIFREHGAQTFDAVHARAPAALFEACARTGVRFVVQVSALGAGAAAATRFLRSKHEADEALARLPLDAAVVRPSLVFSEAGESSRLFLTLAALPLLALPDNGAPRVQPVHLDDVAAGIVELVGRQPQGQEVFVFAGPRAMPLAEYLALLRTGMGIARRQRLVPLPRRVWDIAAAAGERLRAGLLGRESLAMLRAGNEADASAFAALLGRAPRSAESFIGDAHGAWVRAAVPAWAAVIRVAVAFVWLWTAAVSAGLYPVQDSLAMLARLGLHGSLAASALYGAAALDLLLGLLTLVLPARQRRLLWPAQVLLIAGYTLLITAGLPEQWLHPFGPISKNIPMLAAIGFLWSLDRRARI